MLRIIILFLCLLGPLLLGAEDSVSEAWAYLLQPNPNRGDTAGATDKDLSAVTILRANKPEAERLAIAALRKGDGRERGDEVRRAEGWVGSIFDKTDLLRIARIVVRTYEVGDKSTPFMGFLVNSGKKEDMELSKQWIRLDPNGEAAVNQAAYMAESDNPYAHAALLELRREVPGKWQQSYYVEKFFRKQATANSPGSKASMATKTEPVTTSHSHLPQPQEPTSVTTDASSGGGFIGRWWLLGGVAVMVVAVIIILRRRQF